MCHLTAAFDKHAYCGHYNEKRKGTGQCTMETEDCSHCNILTEEQKLRLVTPSYGKCEMKDKSEVE